MALKNHAKERLKRGEAICGFGITMSSPGLAQVLCASGLDFLTIDLEHGAIDAAGAHSLIAASAASACVPVVRVPTTESWAVKQALDAGALGVVFPMVRSREEVERSVSSALYPPAGSRGVGHHFAPARWGVTGQDYLREANDAMLNIILVETREAAVGIADLVAVPGLDVATIAPGDLAAALGHPGQLQHPEVVEAISALEKAILASNVALGGVATSATDIRAKLQRGYRVLVLGFDVGLVQNAATELVRAVRG